MVQTVVLHAGPHKTGTTALQRAFSANSDLLARHGVLYPAAGRLDHSHALLGEALLLGDTSMLTALAAEAAGWRVALISTEHLSALSIPALSALRDIFPKAEFRVSYMLRRLARLWPSHWAEKVKHTQDLSFSGYLERVSQRDERPFLAPVLPCRQLDRLTSVFGEASLRLHVYDAFQSEGHDMGPAFIDDMLGLGQIAPRFATLQTNLTPGDLETALAYLMNRHAGPVLDYATKTRMRRTLLTKVQSDCQPLWLGPLKAALDQCERMILTQDHPLVDREQSAVIARYGSILRDSVAGYLAPIQVSVPCVETLHFGGDVETALSAEFDLLTTAETSTSGTS